jgi:hypothetical protein
MMHTASVQYFTYIFSGSLLELFSTKLTPSDAASSMINHGVCARCADSTVAAVKTDWVVENIAALCTKEGR